MMNAIGLQNVGVKAFIEKKLPAAAPIPKVRRHRERFRLDRGRLP